MALGIRVVCQQCRAAYRIESGIAAGETASCPKCGAKAIVPQHQDAETGFDQATLAGSPDDRRVTLSLPPIGGPTRVIEGAEVEVSVEDALLSTGPSSTRYAEEGVIAQGGMGEIVLCIDRDTRRQVAMKRMLPATAADPARRARFVEEAQVTAQLEHPNIVPVHELRRRDDGSVYFTMKLVKGKSLADILKEMKDAGEPPLGKGGFPRIPSPKPSGPATQKSLERGSGENLSPERLSPGFSLSDLLQVFLKVCDGVAFAHSRGVIHRDLKPANIMVGDYGEVLVMDWGLAKVKGREDIRASDIVGGASAPRGAAVGGVSPRRVSRDGDVPPTVPPRALNCEGAPVVDVEPLRGLPLESLRLKRTPVKDLTPLAGMKLKEFWPPPKKQLTAESLKVAEELEKQGCKIIWEE